MEKNQITIKRRKFTKIVKACQEFSANYNTYDTDSETLKIINTIVDDAIICHYFPPELISIVDKYKDIKIPFANTTKSAIPYSSYILSLTKYKFRLAGAAIGQNITVWGETHADAWKQVYEHLHYDMYDLVTAVCCTHINDVDTGISIQHTNTFFDNDNN